VREIWALERCSQGGEEAGVAPFPLSQANLSPKAESQASAVPKTPRFVPSNSSE